MATVKKFFRPFVALSLIAVGLSGVSPATADTVDLTPITTLEWNEGQTTAVQFDPSGRLWVWNTGYTPSLPYKLQVNVFVKESDGDWSHSFRWKPRRFFPSKISFASNGTMYATDDCSVGIVTFKANGAVKKLRTVKFKRGFCPQVATPIDGDKVVLVSDEQVQEHQLPLKSKSRALRTITFAEEYPYNSRILVANDGTVYRSHNVMVSDGVDVYPSTLDGTEGPARSFTIHPDFGQWYITGMSLGFDDNIYLRVNGDILVYAASTSGPNETPTTEWNLGTDPSRSSHGLAFDGLATFVTVDYGQSPSLKFYTFVD